MGAYSSKELAKNSELAAARSTSTTLAVDTDNFEEMNVAKMDNLPQITINANFDQLLLAKDGNLQDMVRQSSKYDFIHLTQELNQRNMMQLAECFSQAKDYVTGIRELVQQRLPTLTNEYNIPCMDKQSIDVYIKSHHRLDETLYILGRMANPQVFETADSFQED